MRSVGLSGTAANFFKLRDQRVEIAGHHILYRPILVVAFNPMIGQAPLGIIIRADAFAALAAADLAKALVGAGLFGFGFFQRVELGTENLPGADLVLHGAAGFHAVNDDACWFV